jgi:uncharacterized integral membrane protein
MSQIPRSANYLVDLVLNTPVLLDEVKKSPEETLRHLAKEVTNELEPAFLTDRWVYRMVVGALGLVAVGAVLGAIILAARSGTTVTIPDVITALGSAAIGALAGILVPSPTAKQTT